jgi:outer membrane protein
MKDYVKIMIVLMILGFAADCGYAQKQKFGHINSDELMKVMPGSDSAVAKFSAYAKELDSIAKIMQEELNAKYDYFTKNEAKMSDLIKQTKSKELQELQGRIQSFQTSAQEDLKKQQAEILQPIIDKAKGAIDKVAKANGYTYIFDNRQGILLYASPTDDIFPLVKKELGIK